MLLNKKLFNFFITIILTINFSTVFTAEEEKELSIDKKEIRIGYSGSLTGPTSNIGTELEAGLKLRINEQNEKGGIDGKNIKLITLDNKYDPEEQKKNIDEFKKLKVDIFVSSGGSFPFKNFIPSIEKKENLVLFPDAASPIFRKTEYNYLIHFIASSKTMGQGLMEYTIKTLNLKKIFIVYQTEIFSEGAFEGAKKILLKNNLKEDQDWLAKFHNPETKNFKDITKAIKGFDPEAILFLSTFPALESIIKELGASYFQNKKALAMSSVVGEKFYKLLLDTGLKIPIAESWPNPESSDIQIIKEFYSKASEKNIPITTSSLEGYIAADLLIYTLEKIKDNITKENIVKEIEKWKNLLYKGFTLNFNKKTREIFNLMWINSEKNTWLQINIEEDEKEAKDPEKNKDKVKEKETEEQAKEKDKKTKILDKSDKDEENLNLLLEDLNKIKDKKTLIEKLEKWIKKQKIEETEIKEKKKEPEEEKLRVKEKKKEISKEEKEESQKTSKELSISEEEIRLGYPGCLIGPVANIGKEIQQGLLLKIEEQNKTQKIDGKNLKLITLDNKYDPEKQEKDLEEFKKLKVDIFMAAVGSLPFQKFIPSIEAEKNLVLFPDAASPIFRKKEYKYLLHLISSSYETGQASIYYLVKKLKINKFAILYQKEPFSEGAVEGALNICKKYNLEENKDWIKTFHSPGSIDVKNAAQEIKKFNPNAIIYLSTLPSMQALFKELKMDYMALKTHIANTAVIGIDLSTFLTEYGLNLFIVDQFPSINSSDIQLIQEFRELALNKNIPITSNAFEGYMVADLVIKTLNDTKPPITKEKIIANIESWKNLHYKGFTLNFDPKSRRILDFLCINSGQKTIETLKISDLEKEEN